MADPGLIQALDYILNKSDASSMDVLSEAVIRRRRNMSLFNAIGDIPDPQKTAQEISEKVNASIGGSIDVMKKSIREMIVRIVKEHAPELSSKQIDELCQAWLPDATGSKLGMPSDVLVSMIEQFVSFSCGTMNEAVDKSLRSEMGAWPERYWKTFPGVVRQLITDFLKSRITEKDFWTKIGIALGK